MDGGEALARLDGVGQLLVQHEADGKVYFALLRRAAAAQVHAHEADTHGVDVVYITRRGRGHLKPHRGLGQEGGLVDLAGVAALGADEVREFLQRRAAFYAAQELLPRLGLA